MINHLKTYIKRHVYADKLLTIKHLKTNIYSYRFIIEPAFEIGGEKFAKINYERYFFISFYKNMIPLYRGPRSKAIVLTS